MKRLLILIIAFMTFFVAGCINSHRKIIGIKIYEYNGDFIPLIKNWKQIGINSAFISKELAENKTFRKLLKENDISIFIIFPVFFNPVFLRDNDTLYSITGDGQKAKDDWVEFVCPSSDDYRKMKIDEALNIVRDLDPEGLSVDFIRQFVFWEKVYPESNPGSIKRACFCDRCINEFCHLYEVKIPEGNSATHQKSRYITENFDKSWTNYQCDLVTSMVRELSEKSKALNPDIKINVHAVPWRDEDFDGAIREVAGQDLEKIAKYTDFISPMCYSHMLRRNHDWIDSVISEFNSKAPGMILPSIQVNTDEPDGQFGPEEFRMCLDAALKPPSRGVVFFSWPLFLRDTSRLEIVAGKILD